MEITVADDISAEYRGLVQSILEVSENGVVFETCNSIYRLSYTRVPMEMEAMCA